MIEHTTPTLPGRLAAAFDLGVGYHSPCWVDVSYGGYEADRDIPDALGVFLAEVAGLAQAHVVAQRVGVAYVRVIDGADPENYMAWHVDPLDDAVRFTAAIATDDRRVSLAWPSTRDLVGRPVKDTWLDADYHQHDNGTIVGFTTEPHGVLPQDPRPGQLTAVFFATIYRDRAAADLYLTNNTQTGSHAMLPDLEPTRG